MKSIYIKVLLIVIGLNLVSCTKEISVDVAHVPQTIIHGQLNNLNQTVSISIQQTLPLNSSESFKAINDATISLFEKNNGGNTALVTDSFSVSNGIYSSAQTIPTTVGNLYWIEVALPDGSRFKSAEEVMNPVVPISEIQVGDQFEPVLNIIFSDPENTTNFYQLSVALYNQGQLVSVNSNESNDVIFDGNEQASLEIDILRFTEDDEPIIYDSVEILLGNINFESYQFLLNQRIQQGANEDANDSSPSQLFSTPPVNLLGNITNQTTNRTILGNFSISALSVENQ